MRGKGGSTVERQSGWFYLVVGFAVGGLWLASLPGAFEDGVLTYAGTEDVGNIPIFHLVAELTMAVTALGAGWALHREAQHARTLAYLASGMLTYSAINSSGWLLHNQPVVLAATAGTLVGSTVAAVALAMSREGS